MIADPTPPLLAAAVLLTAAAGYCDLRSGLIPNRLLALAAPALLAWRLALAALAGGSTALLAGLLSALVGVLAAGLVPLLLFRAGGMGGGDVKLLATLGLALGPIAALEAQLYAFALLLLYAPARLLYEGTLLRTLAASGALLLRPFVPASKRAASAGAGASFRFAPALFVATSLCVALRWGAP